MMFGGVHDGGTALGINREKISKLKMGQNRSSTVALVGVQKIGLMFGFLPE